MIREVPDVTREDFFKTAEYLAQLLVQESQDDWQRRYPIALLEEIRKYRSAGNRRADTEKLFDKICNFFMTCLEIHKRNREEPLLRSGMRAIDGGRKSKREKNPAILAVLERKLKADPAATNLDLWKSFYDCEEIVETEKGRFELDMDVVELDISPEETRLFIYPVKDGRRGTGRSISFNTFINKYASLVRKNLKK